MKRIASLLIAGLFLALPLAAQDMDRDGIPDNLDRRPTVAGYPMMNPPLPFDRMAQSADADSDRDGIPDNWDNRPWVMEYPKFGAGVSFSKYRTDAVANMDSDWDGLNDGLDNRPHVMEYPMMLGAMPTRQEPTKAADSDGDGVTDDKDRCPNTPAGARVDANGCSPDSDGDGVADDMDKCPNTARGVAVGSDGCPRDSDGDGVTDDKDRCPNTPSGAQVNAEGCPLDSDEDGVPDYADKCANTPRGIPVDETGCPKLIKKGEKIILDVQFATNSSEMDAESRGILDGVATTMKEFTDIKVAIRGFTDDRGSASYNQTLSEKRAKAVLDYLANAGVTRNRMSSKGFGEDPKYFVGDNNTEEGRQQNRRVEIESVE